MTPEQIAEGRRLLDEALTGPWTSHPSERSPGLTAIAIPGSMHPVANTPDAELIVWARNNLPALLDALDRVRALAADLEAAPMVGSSSEEQWEFDTERRCGREIRTELDGDA